MGKSFLADIPGANVGAPVHITNASVASNGGSSQLDQFVAPGDLKILSVSRIVQANEATHGTATTSATYRQWVLLDNDATVTLASLNQTASQAANATKAFALSTGTVTVAKGHVVLLSQTTVGGTDNDGTVVSAGSTDISYELL